MSENASQIHGYTDVAIGSVKEKIGVLLKNQKLEIEGKARRFAGKAEITAASDETEVGEVEGEEEEAYEDDDEKKEEVEDKEYKERAIDRANEPSLLHGYMEQVIGGVQDTIGWVLEDTKLQIAGKSRILTGKYEVAAAHNKTSTESDIGTHYIDEAHLPYPSHESERRNKDLIKNRQLEETAKEWVESNINDPSVANAYKAEFIMHDNPELTPYPETVFSGNSHFDSPNNQYHKKESLMPVEQLEKEGTRIINAIDNDPSVATGFKAQFHLPSNSTIETPSQKNNDTETIRSQKVNNTNFANKLSILHKMQLDGEAQLAAKLAHETCER